MLYVAAPTSRQAMSSASDRSEKACLWVAATGTARGNSRRVGAIDSCLSTAVSETAHSFTATNLYFFRQFPVPKNFVSDQTIDASSARQGLLE